MLCWKCRDESEDELSERRRDDRRRPVFTITDNSLQSDAFDTITMQFQTSSTDDQNIKSLLKIQTISSSFQISVYIYLLWHVKIYITDCALFQKNMPVINGNPSSKFVENK